jgi:hypothetical protein
MRKAIYLVFFCCFYLYSLPQTTSQSSAQTDNNYLKKIRSIADFRNKIYYADIFSDFTRENAPGFNVAANSSDGNDSKRDTSHITATPTFNFQKHPFFGSYPIKGKLVWNTSVCADHSCVYESRQTVYFCFDNESEARKILNMLSESLLSLGVQKKIFKEGKNETHTFKGESTERYLNYITLTLSPAKDGFEILID